MSDARSNPPSTAHQAFTPKETVSISIGSLTANVYPRIDPLMSIAERAHAFHVTRSALHTLPLLPSAHLDALGNQLCSSAAVDGIKADFDAFLKESLFDMNNLTILSFHNSSGAPLPNAVLAADTSILKPVADGPVADCRPEDVRFVRVQLVLDFRDLASAAGPNENTVLRAAYYIELPQNMQVVNNANGAPRNLTTFLGPDDLRTLDEAAFRATILDHVPQDGPIDLGESAFNLTSASIDEVQIRLTINHAVLRIATKTIEQAVFEQLCPNFTNKPI